MPASGERGHGDSFAAAARRRRAARRARGRSTVMRSVASVNSGARRASRPRGRGSAIGSISLDAARPRRHHDDAVGEQHRLVDAVRDEHDGLARREPQRLEVDAHLLARQRIERAERLVHQQQRRIVDQRAHDRGALAHAAGQLARIAVGELGEADAARAAPSRARDAAADRRRAARAAAARCRAPCASRAAPGSGTRCRASVCGRVDDAAVDAHLAGGRRMQPRDQPQQRALAAAGRPDDREELAARRSSRSIGSSACVSRFRAPLAPERLATRRRARSPRRPAAPARAAAARARRGERTVAVTSPRRTRWCGTSSRAGRSCRSRYFFSRSIVWSQSACAPQPMRPFEFGESRSSMSTISCSSVDWRLRSGLAFSAASTAAPGFFFASSHDFDRRAHEAPHEVGIVLDRVGPA